MAKEKKDINVSREWVKLFLGIALAIFGMGIVAFSLIVDPVGAVHASVVALFGTVLTWVGTMFGIDSNAKIRMHEQNVELEMKTRELDNKMKMFESRLARNLPEEE